MNTDWIIVIGALVGGVVIGLIVAKIISGLLGSEKRPEPLRGAAGPLAGLGFWACVIAGLLVALGVLSPSSLEQLPKDLIAFLPRLMSAAIIVIGANVVAQFATAALAPMTARASASVQRQVGTAVRVLIIGMAALLAVRQLGIDTTVINLGVAAIFFGVAASLTLLVGLGGRDVASEIASTRAVRRLLNAGDRVTIGDISGTVTAIHPTAIELLDQTDGVVLVPSSQLLAETISVTRAQPTPEA